MENPILDQDQSLTGESKFASFWERVGASLVDGLIMLPLIGLTYYNLMSVKSLPLAIALGFVFVIYKIYMEGTSGATFGKRAMKIKVVDENYQPINLMKSAGRCILYILSAVVNVFSTVTLFNAPGFN